MTSMIHFPRRFRSTSSEKAPSRHTHLAMVVSRAEALVRSSGSCDGESGDDAPLLRSQLLGDRHQVRTQEAEAPRAARPLHPVAARGGRCDADADRACPRTARVRASPPPPRSFRPPAHRPGPTRGCDARHGGSSVSALRGGRPLGGGRRAALEGPRRGEASLGAPRPGAHSAATGAVPIGLTESRGKAGCRAKGEVRSQLLCPKILSGLHLPSRSLE